MLNIFPQFKFCERLENFNNLNQKLKDSYTYKLILSLLIVDQTDNYEFFCYKYKASNNIKNKFKNISENFENLKNKKFYSKENIKKLIYLSNKDYARDLLLFSLCINNKIKILNIEKLIDYVANCEIPIFPISGDYLKKHGYVTGQALGKKLKSLEAKWIENNFIIEKKTIEKSLEKVSKD